MKNQISHYLDLNLKFHLCFPKTYANYYEENSLEDNFREKGLAEPILKRRFVLERSAH